MFSSVCGVKNCRMLTQCAGIGCLLVITSNCTHHTFFRYTYIYIFIFFLRKRPVAFIWLMETGSFIIFLSEFQVSCFSCGFIKLFGPVMANYTEFNP